MALVDRGALVAMFSRSQSDLANALQDFGAVIENSRSPSEQKLQAHVNRAQLRLSLANYDAAIEDVRILLRESSPPEKYWAVALLVRAQINALQGNKLSFASDIDLILHHSGIDENVALAAKALRTRFEQAPEV